MANYKYAIFDLDGTLLDSMAYWRSIAKYILEQNEVLVPDELYEKSKYMLTHDAIRWLCAELKTEKIYEYSDEYRDRVLRPAYEKYAQTKPYTEELLKALKANGVTCCIATATDRELFMPAVKRLKIADFFEFNITTADVGKSKFYPDIFDRALSMLGGTKKDTVIFEDSLYSIKTAVASGYRVIGVEDEYAKTERSQIIRLCEEYTDDFRKYIVKTFK